MRRAPIALWIALLAACGGSTSNAPAGPRVYWATASVGDLLVITIDGAAKTIAYEDRTTGQSGTASFTVAVDGGYQITDPGGVLSAAYEIPGRSLILQADHMGQGDDQPALITGVARKPLAKADLVGRGVDFVQLRSLSGGVEVGHIAFDGTGGVAVTRYLPFGAMSDQDGAFLSMSLPGDTLEDDPALGVIDEPAAGATIFGEPGGFLGIDAAKDSTLAWPEAPTKAFDPANAGTYKALVYVKTATFNSGAETGTAQMQPVDVEISEEGHIRLRTASGEAQLDAQLTPFADSNLVGADGATSVTDPCLGLFTFPSPLDGSQLAFVLFMDHELVLGGFAPTSSSPPDAYQYFYGVGLADPAFSPVATDLPACPANDLALTMSPLAHDDIATLTPLGNLNPPEHVFPTEHQYFYLPVVSPNVTASVPIVSPGHLVLTEVESSEHLSEDPVFTDWNLTFTSCDGLSFRFGHVANVEAGIMDRISDVTESCSEHQAGEQSFRTCKRSVHLEVQAGDAIGTAGGRPGQLALDLGARDTRKPPVPFVNPAAHDSAYSRCFLDYATPEVRAALLPRIPRTVDPICGTQAQDVAGSAQGNWRRTGAPTYPESPHLAIVHDMNDPTLIAISIGTSLAPVSPMVAHPATATSGYANRDPSAATAGSTWCWDLGDAGAHRLVVELSAGENLRAEPQAGACGEGPWTLGESAVSFIR